MLTWFPVPPPVGRRVWSGRVLGCPAAGAALAVPAPATAAAGGRGKEVKGFFNGQRVTPSRLRNRLGGIAASLQLSELDWDSAQISFLEK